MPYSPMQLAESFIKTGELTDALDALNQQLEEQPHDDEARRLRIDVLLRLAEVDYLQSALADINTLAEITAADYQRESVLYERLGDTAKAIESMHKAHKLAPADERLSERLLNLLMAQKHYAAALELVREQEKSWRWLQYEGDVLVLMGDDTLATARYGLVLAQLETFEGVMRADYLQGIKARVLLVRAHAYRRLQQIENAREHYQAAQLLLLKDPTISFNLGLLDALSGDIDSAVTQCRAALTNAPQILQDEMRESLRKDAIYSELWARLAENN
jgi:tetratricopeptide (TPR) repeat protein